MAEASRSNDLERQFRETVVAWSLARNDSSAANPLFVRQQELAKMLRYSEDGRRALEALLDDDDVNVQAVAATATLAWSSERGVQRLMTLAERNDLLGFEAETTLKSLRSGTLNLDW